MSDLDWNLFFAFFFGGLTVGQLFVIADLLRRIERKL